MARYVAATAFALCVVSVTSNPDAPLYPNSAFFASTPLLRQFATPQLDGRPVPNVAYTLQNPTSQNPTIFLPAQPNQQRTAAPQGLFRIVSENPVQSVPQNFVTVSRTSPQQVVVPAEQVQSVPRNFVTFTRPAQQVVQTPAEPTNPVLRNFVTFTRPPTQQVVQLPAEQAQPVLRNFVTFTRTPQSAQQQDFGSRTVLVQANEQPVQFAVRAPVQQQLVPASNAEAAFSNALPPQQTGVRTVIFFPAQQASSQTNPQADQKAKALVPTRPRAVLVARPAEEAEQPQLAGNIQNQPSSSQFFTRNFGSSGAVTYFIRPFSAPAGQVAPLNQAADAET